MGIKVKNNCQGGISVAINHWGSTGKTRFFDIGGQGGSEHWDREDSRGFIMRVRTYGNPARDLPYYIHSDSNIVVEDTDWSKGQYVADGGRQLNPAGEGGST
ncbi:hypothetical protein AB1286_24435 [Trinickia sp. NRRL B-1857]|uniref:hypothetical protein n=1 Tax=Trinickia sp. NRRL B-1857 TaxID=3162879 RepID=UPI003D292D17